MDKYSNRNELALSLLILMGLALPLMPVPGDGRAEMRVRFHNSETGQPVDFAANTTRSVCSVMAAALDYRDPETGNFTEITCD